ncbi:hypothetical protein AB0I37_25055 [Micromonospora purpureochromogenes]|uniref:hypothetical protein n=1 Tax=Micromonospora purpureochromogenes TaxID=47872 RepID=UPI0033BFC783
MTTKATCRSTTHHGTYWAYDKHGCRCLNAALDASRIRRMRRNGPTGLIRPAIGAVRTARGLAAYGYTVNRIAAAAGLSNRLIAHLQSGKDTIRSSKDRDLRVAAERLIAATPPTGRGATRARSTARRNGWFPLLAWDDIDDPNAQPSLGDPDAERDRYDPVIVGFAVDGAFTYDQIKDNRADLLEVVRRLATRMSDFEIALHLRWPGAEDGPPGKTRGQGAVCQLRLRNGIPTHHVREVIAPISARDRHRAEQRRTQAA